MSEKVRLMIRGLVGHHKVFEERVDVDMEALDDLPALAQKHALLMMAVSTIHWIEIEFLDETNPLERFYRFGTDPSGMVNPIAVALTEDRGKAWTKGRV